VEIGSHVDAEPSKRSTSRHRWSIGSSGSSYIAHTENRRPGPFFHVAIVSGCHHCKLFGLCWEEFGFAAGTFTIRNAIQRVDGKPTLVPTKTAMSRRSVRLPAFAVAALRVQKNRQAFEHAMASDRLQARGLVLTSTVGTSLQPSDVTHRVQALLE
jgi:hypothetical protein